MSTRIENGRRLLVWLIFFKIGYLASIAVAVLGWPDSYDQAKSEAIDARWFARVESGPTHQSGSAVARHFATWDAQHYLFLSEAGYSEGVRSTAFYPLWPMMIRWSSALTGASPVVTGMVLANLFSLAAFVLFHRIVVERFGTAAANWALVFLIVFPGSLFYQFIYSEPLFLLLVMVLWFALERYRHGMAWVAALLLPLCRGVGIFSVLPIGWYCLMRSRWRWIERWRWLDAERKRARSGARDPAWETEAAGWLDASRWREWGLVVGPPLGIAFYFAWMWGSTGNAFEGFDAQRFWGVHSIGNLWNVPKIVIGLATPMAWHDLRGSLLDRAMFLVLVYSLPVIWRLGKDMVVWTCVLGIVPAMSGTFTSYTRFAACVFPVFIALAVFTEGTRLKWFRWGLLIGFGLLHLVLLWRFVNFRWAG